MNGVTWSILGLIIALLIAIGVEARRQQRTTVPAAVRAVRARHAAPESDEPTPVDVPVPANDGQGATPEWSPAAELAAVGDGELLPAGTPTVSIDEFTDLELWDAEFGADLRRCDNRIEAARRLCASNMAAAGCAPMTLMQEIDLRDMAAERLGHEWAVAPVSDVEPLAQTSRPHKPDCGPRARRDRKRANKVLGR